MKRKMTFEEWRHSYYNSYYKWRFSWWFIVKYWFFNYKFGRPKTTKHLAFNWRRILFDLRFLVPDENGWFDKGRGEFCWPWHWHRRYYERRFGQMPEVEI